MLRACEKMGTGSEPVQRNLGKAASGEVPVPILSQALRTCLLVAWFGVGLAALPAEFAAAQTKPDGVLFSESFDDSDLAKRGWYDGSQFRIVGGALAGKGCIEYEWADRDTKVSGSSPVRRLFEPTDQVAIRFYLTLSKGWGWSGQNFHPHLTHFLTTENPKDRRIN